MNTCPFCVQNRFHNNLKVGFTLAESLVYEDEYVFITPDLSPLAPGHVLIVSQNHYTSFSSAPIEVRKALQKAIIYIHDNFGYRDITWFEHGSVFPGKGGASIDHAHLHVLPNIFPVQQAVEYDNRYMQIVPFSMEVFSALADKQPYLWISNGLYSSSIYYVDHLPSQYLRGIVMQLQGSNLYNWKDNFTKKESIEKYRKTLIKTIKSDSNYA
jgi:diadenosine tetraphosphate (Ap4A) HIT family hydrolase